MTNTMFSFSHENTIKIGGLFYRYTGGYQNADRGMYYRNFDIVRDTNDGYVVDGSVTVESKRPFGASITTERLVKLINEALVG